MQCYLRLGSGETYEARVLLSVGLRAKIATGGAYIAIVDVKGALERLINNGKK
jgi:hypothetical protein